MTALAVDHDIETATFDTVTLAAAPHDPRGPAPLPMSDGDRRHWLALEDGRGRILPTPERGVRHRAGAFLGAGLRMLPRVPSLPGLPPLPGLTALPGLAAVDEAVVGALDGLDALGARWGRATVSADAVVRAFQRAGHAVSDLADLRTLDLDDVHAVRPALARDYTVASAVQGGLSGALAGFGPMLVSGTVGGVAALAAALAADTLLTAATCARAVAHVGLYHGYDPTDPTERARAADVVTLAVAPREARPAAWERFWAATPAGTTDGTTTRTGPRTPARPDADVVTAVRAARVMGHCELAQALPALGVGVGAALSALLVARVLDTAEHLYRERFLREKYGLGAPTAPIGASAASGSSS